jgi:ABC-type branched-subunit amino acid transport system substrate-binding protein
LVSRSAAVYDALYLICAAIKKTGGNTNGDALIAAMKGTAWESPRGPVSIDPETREMVQDVFTMSSSRNSQPLGSRPRRNSRDRTLSTVLFRFAKQGVPK